MLLENAEKAIIRESKVRGYLLNPEHPKNGGKAAIFAVLGYSSQNWHQLELDIREQHLSQDAVQLDDNLHGRKWKIEAVLNGPRGSARIRTIWIFPFSDDVPALVSAYRLK